MQTPAPDFDLERYLPYRLTVIAGRLSAEIARQYKARFGISLPEWRVLLNVGHAENLSIRDIEKRADLEKSKVSRAASKLEAKGYLRKHVDARDKRLLQLSLTEEGRQLLDALIPIAAAFQADLDARLGGHRDALHEALDRLLPAEEA
ncbi:MarR family transcriptional regulator [Dinoroseobacter sp. PD6]|uniref:MarR family winged helix-turn-helix transcriptional regulator n=1 Tax=Dinoroseobacter sp. PD6 TaxID=3028384 RepID=UPI00237A0C5F|nr:MarR family transcriptional regulator [Dinoroseobacter sp. PD6]MDD9718785.1 MarR family transcriptional regulator [Dinoroseobacter sp. PD6]